MNKKGAELTINIIIGVAIVIIALIILLTIFSSNLGKQSKEYNQYIEGKKKIQTYINMLPDDFKEVQTQVSKISSQQQDFNSAMQEIRVMIPNNKLMGLINKEGYDLCILGEDNTFFTTSYDSSTPHQIICLLAEKQEKMDENTFKIKEDAIKKGGIYVGMSGKLKTANGGIDSAKVYLCKCPI